MESTDSEEEQPRRVEKRVHRGPHKKLKRASKFLDSSSSDDEESSRKIKSLKTVGNVKKDSDLSDNVESHPGHDEDEDSKGSKHDLRVSDSESEEKSRPQQSRPNSPSSSSDESGGHNDERKSRVVIQNVSEDEDENPNLDLQRSSPEPELEHDEERGEGMVVDFDLMLQRKREENRRYRKKTGIDVINDNDDAIAKLIADMREAAREDRSLNAQGYPATKKIGMLNTVMRQINKADLAMAFVEANILAVITDWLAPIGDKRILPHVHIRERLLQYCDSIPLDASRLKESGIGKAVMYLSGHPKETRDNRNLARKLISKWSRPIFNLNSDFLSMSREDRQRRDKELSQKLGEASDRQSAAKRSAAEKEANVKPLRPGEPGWIARARVPQVDNREYVNRPEWQTTVDMTRNAAKKEMSMLEKHKRMHADRKKSRKVQAAVKVNLEGKHSLNFNV